MIHQNDKSICLAGVVICFLGACVASGQENAALQGHQLGVTSVAISPDGAIVASGGFDKTVRLWDTRSHSQLGVLGPHAAWVQAVALSADGKTAASADDEGWVKLWAVPRRTQTANWQAHADGGVIALALSPDGKTLATGSTDLVAPWPSRWNHGTPSF